VKVKTRNPLKGVRLRGTVYWLRYREDGVLRQLSLQTTDPAEAATRALRARHAPELAPKVGLNADIDRFIAAKKSSKKFTSTQTEKWARRALGKLVAFFPGKSVGNITSKDMERFAASLHDVQSETGAMCYLRGIKSFFSWAVSERLRFDNPCKGLVHQPAEPARLRFATKAQRDALIAACEAQRVSKKPKINGEYHEAVHFALFCALHAGMRYNEIVQARPDWFHLEADHPYVEIQNTDTFKTKNRRSRTVPLSTPFVDFLKVYGLREPFMLQSGKEQGKNVYRYDFRKPWSVHVRKHGVLWLTPHAARHTFASLLVQSGESIFKVAKWMGHGVGVCEQHYAHLTPGDSGIDRML
jgi:integrase